MDCLIFYKSRSFTPDATALEDAISQKNEDCIVYLKKAIENSGVARLTLTNSVAKCPEPQIEVTATKSSWNQ